MVAAATFQVCSNPIAETAYKAGIILTKPFLFEMNMVTKWFAPDLRPGKCFADLSLGRKTWKILRSIS